MKLNWNFQRGGGWGLKTKNHPWGVGVWIFSGTTHVCKHPCYHIWQYFALIILFCCICDRCKKDNNKLNQ